MVSKSELIEKIAAKEVCSLSAAKMQLDVVVSTISEALLNGDSVRLNGLGTLEPRDRAARVGYNPVDGKKIEIPAHKTVAFKVASDFKTKLNG